LEFRRVLFRSPYVSWIAGSATLMIEAIMNATLDPRIVARRTQRRACDAHPGVSGAARTTAASPGGRSATIIRRNRRAVRSRRPFSWSGSAQASPLDLIKVTDAGMSAASSRLRAQREALAHQLLRDLPQTLGVLWVERVRLDAVEGVGSVVHRGHVTVLEIETAAPLELRRGDGEHRGRGPGLDGLELHPAGACLQELPVLRLQVSAELGHDAARMQGIGVHTASPETPLEADREENVGGLRLAVGEPLVVRTTLELDVIEDDRRHVMAARADGNHAARRGPAQSRGEQTGRQEMADVVRAELQLEAVRRFRRWACHDTGIVDEDVKSRVARQEAFREGANLLQRAELELLDLDVLVPRRGANRRRNRLAFRHVSGGENHMGTSLGQDARRLLSQSARAA